MLGDGIGVTVDGIECGEPSALDTMGIAHDAIGQFCSVMVTIVNGSEMPALVRADDVAVRIGGVAYPATTAASDLGGTAGATAVDPTQGLAGRFVVDVPVGAAIDRIEVRGAWSGGTVMVVEMTG